MKRKRKLLVLLLTACLIVSTLPLNAYAVQEDFSNSREVYTDENLNITLERIIDNEKVTVFVKSLDGEILHTLINENGKIYLDGEVINSRLTNNLYSNFSDFDTSDFDTSDFDISSISWGRWSSSYQTFDTSGLTAPVIAGLITLTAPWVGLRIAGMVAGVIVSNYDSLGINIQIRYGTDDRYQYYERITDFYGDDEHISGPFRDSGKKYLD